MQTKISICIACHNQAHLLPDAIDSCLAQEYKNFEIILLDDASTKPIHFPHSKVKVIRSNEPSGTGGAFNKAIAQAAGEYVVLLCADDIFTNNYVLGDIVKIFDSNRHVGHITRHYHQFIGEDRSPVRAWRCHDVIELANNPSGLAFRKMAIGKCELSNKMFVEASSFVNCILKKGWDYRVMGWDTVAVRIHQSISRSKDYYRKRWTTSPVEEWSKVGGRKLATDFTSLIQIKNYFTTSAVIKECGNFIKVRPLNLLMPGFWFFAAVSIMTPRFILLKAPDIYKKTIGKLTTREKKRPEKLEVR